MDKLIFKLSNLAALPAPEVGYKTIGIDQSGVVNTKDATGLVEEVGGTSAEVEFDILYSDETQLLQLFDESTQITTIQKSSTVGTFSYSVNGASFSNITLPLASDIVINNGDEIIWKVDFNNGQELGSVNLSGFKIV
jgi:hypothetical protein